MAQDDDDLVDPVLIRLKGKLVNKDDGSPVPYANIVDMRNHGGTTTNEDGYFSIEILNIDSLAVTAIGYVKDYLHIPPAHNPDSLMVFRLRPVRYAIGEVKVKGESKKLNLYGISTGKPDSIPPQLRGDAFNKRPPWYAAIFTPASFLQYHLSKREKEKRDVRQAMISSQEWERLSKFYNKDMVMKLTGLNEEQADSFMIYFNMKAPLNARSTEYDVREAIIREFENYKKEKAEIEKQSGTEPESDSPETKTRRESR